MGEHCKKYIPPIEAAVLEEQVLEREGTYIPEILLPEMKQEWSKYRRPGATDRADSVASVSGVVGVCTAHLFSNFYVC